MNVSQLRETLAQYDDDAPVHIIVMIDDEQTWCDVKRVNYDPHDSTQLLLSPSGTIME